MCHQIDYISVIKKNDQLNLIETFYEIKVNLLKFKRPNKNKKYIRPFALVLKNNYEKI